MKKIKILIFLCLTMMVSSCGNSNTSNPSGVSDDESIPSTSISDDSNTSTTNPTDDSLDIEDLLDDENANGIYGSEENVDRIPEGEINDIVNEKIRPLKTGETYIETFDKDYLHSKLVPSKADRGVNYIIGDDNKYAINGKTLFIESPGNYNSVSFKGMKFSANATYTINLDYRVISPSNDFFIQFRSIAKGIDSDIYHILTGRNNNVQNESFTITLDDYDDYYFMIFPRNNPGSISVDNISFTRENSKPCLLDVSLKGDLEVGNKITFEYKYFDAENDELVKVDIEWFMSVNKNGLNKEKLNCYGNSLLITEDMKNKYIQVTATPFSDSIGDNKIGLPTNIITSDPVGGNNEIISEDVELSIGQKITEDFESTNNELGNIYFLENDKTTSYITSLDNYKINGQKSLYINSPGNYSSLLFKGIKIIPNTTYKISFKFKLLSDAENVYLQFRSKSNDYTKDKFVNLDLSSMELNKILSYECEITTGDINDYYFMLFTAIHRLEICIDDLTFERKETKEPIIIKELNVGDKVTEDFNDVSNVRYTLDNSQTPNSKIMESTGELYFESEGAYKCLFIKGGLIYTPNATYTITFNYKIISFTDTMYFQLNGPAVYKEFGQNKHLNQTYQFNETFKIGNNSNYLIQIFPGSANGQTKILIDNLSIERIK